MDANALLVPAAILGLRILGISLSTIRTLLMVRGQKLFSVIISLVEFLTYAFSIGAVVQDLTDPWNLSAYAVGSAVGIWAGMVIEQRVVGGYAAIDAISPQRSHEIAEAVRDAGYGATEGWGHGAEGQVGTVRIVVRRKEIGAILAIINRVDPGAFVTVEETSRLQHGYLRLGHP
ncbi:MAG: DUF5698 domain-containing protein [Anaerolineae bacterium]|nr:DUF5698 domain-containing protein [Anaerolineae bacterium]